VGPGSETARAENERKKEGTVRGERNRFGTFEGKENVTGGIGGRLNSRAGNTWRHFGEGGRKPKGLVEEVKKTKNDTATEGEPKTNAGWLCAWKWERLSIPGGG